jgi:hypothetical protein
MTKELIPPPKENFLNQIEAGHWPIIIKEEENEAFLRVHTYKKIKRVFYEIVRTKKNPFNNNAALLDALCYREPKRIIENANEMAYLQKMELDGVCDQVDQNKRPDINNL